MKNTSPRTVLICVTTLLCATSTLLVKAGVSTTPVLVSDNFDTGNTVGAAPADWKVNAPAGTSVRVVDASVKEPTSPPYCVELIDNSTTGRAEMFRSFTPSESGRASAAFKMNTRSTGHTAMVLRGAKGANLCMVIFTGSGLMRYQHQGGSTNSTMSWTPGQWQTAEIEWFSNFTFTASLGGTPFVQRAHFVTNEVPTKIAFIIGYNPATNRIGYIDDVKVLGAEAH